MVYEGWRFLWLALSAYIIICIVCNLILPSNVLLLYCVVILMESLLGCNGSPEWMSFLLATWCVMNEVRYRGDGVQRCGLLLLDVLWYSVLDIPYPPYVTLNRGCCAGRLVCWRVRWLASGLSNVALDLGGVDLTARVVGTARRAPAVMYESVFCVGYFGRHRFAVDDEMHSILRHVHKCTESLIYLLTLLWAQAIL